MPDIVLSDFTTSFSVSKCTQEALWHFNCPGLSAYSAENSTQFDGYIGQALKMLHTTTYRLTDFEYKGQKIYNEKILVLVSKQLHDERKPHTVLCNYNIVIPQHDHISFKEQIEGL